MVNQMVKYVGRLAAIAVIGAPLAYTTSANAFTLFTDRATFEASLNTLITDDYEDPGYTFTQSDAVMSAVFGETQYRSTGFTDTNLVPMQGGNHYYCAGCNGSYELDFTATSIGTAQGVFGVGLDVFGAEDVYGTTAFVTFGDDSTANFAIPAADGSGPDPFWGITDNLMIKTIHFGLPDGGVNTSNSVQRMAHDNLTIGAEVPVPASAAMMGGLAVALGAAAVRRAKKQAA